MNKSVNYVIVSLFAIGVIWMLTFGRIQSMINVYMQPFIYGTVVSISDDYVLLKVTGWNEDNDSFDYDDPVEVIKYIGIAGAVKDDSVKVYYNGAVSPGDPPRINTVYHAAVYKPSRPVR